MTRTPPPMPMARHWPLRGQAALLATLALLGGLCAALPAKANGPTWIWLDDAGRRVYSDQPPPANLPPKRLLQAGSARPATTEPTPAGAAGAGNGGNAPAGTPGPAGQPASPGGNAPTAGGPAQAPAAETPQQAAQRRAVESRNAQIRAENCQSAQAAMTTLRSNARLMMTNADGRPVAMDAASRQAEMARLQQIIGANCN